ERENQISQLVASHGEGSETENQSQPISNIQTADVPGCSHWGAPNPMVPSFPQLSVAMYQQIGGAGSNGRNTIYSTHSVTNPVISHHKRTTRQPLKQSVVPLDYSSVSSEEHQSDYSIEEGEIEDLSEYNTEPEKAGFKGLFRP
ncbi:hypothetical protein E2320_009763, partial [Naja naja]